MKINVSAGFCAREHRQAAGLFWNAFADKLHTVMGPQHKALAFLERTLDPAYALVARDASGQMQGLAGFKTTDGGFANGSLSDLAEIYGWPGAFWRALVLSFLERNVQPGVFQMDGICVAPQARGKGVGTALLAAIKTEARRQSMSQVHLDVIDTNPRARALYEREGFYALRHEKTGPLKYLFGFKGSTRMSWAVEPA
ncbi:MAG: GNAT family N-acetyltransferase [Pseudomonadota bacterium]